MDQSPALTDPAPTDLDRVLSPEWLTQVLGGIYRGVEVEAIRIVETFVTVATKVRFEVQYRNRPADVPTQFCVKGFFGEPGAAFMSSGASETEVNFYKFLAPTLNVRLPNCIYAQIDPATRHGLILMLDMVPAGARFLTALEPYSVDQAAASLDQLAALNAQYWNGKDFDKLPWLKPQLEQLAHKQVMPVEMLNGLLEGARGQGIDPPIKDGARIYRGLVALAGSPEASRPCILHGDCHAGNVFETAQGTGLIDWQLTQRGCWALDASYHIAAVLTVEARAQNERDLLAHYLERLRVHGAEPPGWEEAWKLYRQSLVYGYFLWSITRRVAEPITIEFVQRLGRAVMEHDSFGLLDVE